MFLSASFLDAFPANLPANLFGRAGAVTTTLALVLLYILLAGFFAVLLIIADRIRHAGDSVSFAIAASMETLQGLSRKDLHQGPAWWPPML